MHVLVTGGAGYLGTVLCTALLEAGHEARCMDTPEALERMRVWPVGGASSALQRVPASITDADAVRRALRGCEAVLHLAGLASDRACDRDPNRARVVNRDAALMLAETARTQGCRRFVNASSCSVYGAGAGALLTEESPTNPLSLYAMYKLEVEVALNRLANATFVPVHLRQATLFGSSPHMRFDLAVNAMTADAVRLGCIVVRGGGRQWRPFLHVRDAAAAFVAALEAPDEAVRGQVFNVGNDTDNHRIIDVAEIVRSQVPGARLLITPEQADSRSYRVGFSKVTNHLGWKALHCIEDGVAEVRSSLVCDVQDLMTRQA